MAAPPYRSARQARTELAPPPCIAFPQPRGDALDGATRAFTGTLYGPRSPQAPLVAQKAARERIADGALWR